MIYVYPDRVPGGGLAEAQLYADSLEELHAAALELRLRSSKYQRGGLLAHYDITARERVRAIKQLHARPVDQEWRKARIRAAMAEIEQGAVARGERQRAGRAA